MKAKTSCYKNNETLVTNENASCFTNIKSLLVNPFLSVEETNIMCNGEGNLRMKFENLVLVAKRKDRSMNLRKKIEIHYSKMKRSDRELPVKELK